MTTLYNSPRFVKSVAKNALSRHVACMWGKCTLLDVTRIPSSKLFLVIICILSQPPFYYQNPGGGLDKALVHGS